MALAGKQVTVGTSATLITAVPADSTYGQSLTVTNRGTASVYLDGTTSVSTSKFELRAGETVSAQLDPDERLYAIAASGSHRLDVLEQGV